MVAGYRCSFSSETQRVFEPSVLQLSIEVTNNFRSARKIKTNYSSVHSQVCNPICTKSINLHSFKEFFTTCGVKLLSSDSKPKFSIFLKSCRNFLEAEVIKLLKSAARPSGSGRRFYDDHDRKVDDSTPTQASLLRRSIICFMIIIPA